MSLSFCRFSVLRITALYDAIGLVITAKCVKNIRSVGQFPKNSLRDEHTHTHTHTYAHTTQTYKHHRNTNTTNTHLTANNKQTHYSKQQTHALQQTTTTHLTANNKHTPYSKYQNNNKSYKHWRFGCLLASVKTSELATEEWHLQVTSLRTITFCGVCLSVLLC